VLAAQEFARNLAAAIGQHSYRSVAGASGIAHPTVSDLLAGRTWPDFVSVVRLEIGLGARLWPDTTGADGDGRRR
jgi:hypothetical protein